VLQGENDIRVPKEEAEQVVAIYKESGKTVDSHFLSAGRAWVLLSGRTRLMRLRGVVAWFDRYLKGTKVTEV